MRLLIKKAGGSCSLNQVASNSAHEPIWFLLDKVFRYFDIFLIKQIEKIEKKINFTTFQIESRCIVTQSGMLQATDSAQI